MLAGSFQVNKPAAVIATLGIVLAALYIPLCTSASSPVPGCSPTGRRHWTLSWREKAVVIPIIASSVLGFLHPKPVLDLVNPAVKQTMDIVGASTGPDQRWGAK